MKCPDCNGSGYCVSRDAGGKILKPPDWTPPDIAKVLSDEESRSIRSRKVRRAQRKTRAVLEEEP